jgi:hypothetical protein
MPVWTRRGAELLYLRGDREIRSLPMSAGRPAGDDVRLFDVDLYTDLVGRTFDVSPDGERVLAVAIN